MDDAIALYYSNYTDHSWINDDDDDDDSDRPIIVARVVFVLS